MIPVGTVCVFNSTLRKDHPDNGHVCEVTGHGVCRTSGDPVCFVSPPLKHKFIVKRGTRVFDSYKDGECYSVLMSSLTPLYQGDANTVIEWSECLWKPEDLKCT